MRIMKSINELEDKKIFNNLITRAISINNVREKFHKKHIRTL